MRSPLLCQAKKRFSRIRSEGASSWPSGVFTTQLVQNTAQSLWLRLRLDLYWLGKLGFLEQRRNRDLTNPFHFFLEVALHVRANLLRLGPRSSLALDTLARFGFEEATEVHLDFFFVHRLASLKSSCSTRRTGEDSTDSDIAGFESSALTRPRWTLIRRISRITSASTAGRLILTPTSPGSSLTIA